jgi:hypothetical protein
LQDCDIFIALFTTNFKNSEMCLSEIGAAWVLDKKIFPLILPPVKYENFSPVIAELQADLLLKKEDVFSFINSIHKQLNTLHGIDFQSGVEIEKIINDFLRSTKQYLHKHPDLFKSSSAAENREQKNEVIEDIKEILEAADLSILDEEKKLIKERSKIEWPEDYSMQEHYINEQIQALTGIKKLQNEVKRHYEKNRIVQRAINEWPKDYSMQLYRANEEIEAYMRLK